MTPETVQWLENKIPQFKTLEKSERNTIFDFSMLWSLFEGTVMNCFCNVSEIRKFANTCEQSGKLQNIHFENYLIYLQQRYYVNGSLTDHFQHLHINKSGNPSEVIEALCNNSASNKVKFIGCLIIVFRLRNNLFHGVKWQYQFEGQKENFNNANEFLRNIMNGV